MQLFPGHTEFRVNFKFVNAGLGFHSLHNMLQLLETMCIILCSLVGIHIQCWLPIGEHNIIQKLGVLDDQLMLDCLVIK